VSFAGRDLANLRETYPTFINIPLYVLAEIAIAACDLAEVLGMAIGLNLLFHIPLLYGVAIAIFDTFIISTYSRRACDGSNLSSVWYR
jgi:manganese transport protein